MLDELITGATIVDGTGAPARRGDVGVRDGRIVAVGDVDEAATVTLDGDGLVVAPGFVDPHTHYDAQLFWDPYATPSNEHGVTTVIGGNCGFTLAPVKPEDADYTRRMMSKVEGMPLAALENGVDWSWRSFAEYLDRLDGTIAVNAGFLVGHCAVRRFVMGQGSVEGEATEAQVGEMVTLLHQCLDAGGLGFSTTRSNTHSDGDGVPVPSRHASEAEVLALCAAVSEHEGTTLEAIVQGCLDKFSDDEITLLTNMSAELERAHRRRRRARPCAPPAQRIRRGARCGRPHRGADHARARADEHELRHLLRAVPHPRLGRRDEPSAAGAHGRAAPARSSGGLDGEGRPARSRRVPAAG
jgi:N-acyl-D-aspartate/D-glutamate deacylase